MADLKTTLTILGKNETRRALREVRTDVRALGDQFKDLKREAVGLAGITIGVGGLIQATREAAAFSKALAEVSTLLDDASQIDGLQQSVEQLARQYGGDVVTNTKALYQIISAGASDATEATALLTAANRLAIGGVTDVATAASGLTNVLNAYDLSAESAADVSDALFVAMRGGVTTVQQLAEGIGNVAPIAQTAGVSFEQLLAAVSAITAPGVQTSVAFTQLRAALNAVINPTAQAAAEAERLQIQFDLAALRSRGFVGFLEDIRAATGGSEASLAKLFGSIEAFNGALALTGNQAENFASIIENMGDKAGQTAIAVDKMLDTPAAQAARFAAALAELQRALGEAVIQFTPLLEGATDLVDGFASLEVGTGSLVTQLAALALALGAGRLVGSFATYSAATAKAAIDNRRLALATLEGLRAKEADALIARTAAIATLNWSYTLDRATGGLARQAAAAKAAAAANAAYTAAVNASAVASQNLSLSAAAGRGALSLLGGPVGAITTALLVGVTAWSSYGSAATDAAVDVESFADTADRLLGNLTAINQRQIEAAIGLGESTIASIEARIRVVSAALQSTRDEQRAIELRRELVELQAQEIEQGDKLAALRNRLARLGQESATGGTGVTPGLQTENTQIAEIVRERDRLLADLKKIDQQLTAGPDPAEQSSAFNIGRLNTLRGQAGGDLERGDPEGALRKLQEAQQVLAALQESGQASTGYLQTQIRLVSELANRINGESLTPKPDQDEAATSLKDYARVRDEFLKQNPGKSLIEVDYEASQRALTAAIERLQEQANQNAITVPVQTASPAPAGPTPPGFAGGGMMRGPGTGTSDSILARLSRGEYVVRSAAVQRYGPAFFDALNRMRLPKFASGGMVPTAPRIATSGPVESAPIYFDLNGERMSATISGPGVGDIRASLQAELRKRGIK